MCACNGGRNNARKGNTYRPGFQRSVAISRNMNITGPNAPANPNMGGAAQNPNVVRPINYDRLRVEKLRRDAINHAKNHPT